MRIKDYILSNEELNFIHNILGKFQHVFPDTRIIEKGDIIGIGEPTKHLFCYFILKNNELVVKFKNQTNHMELSGDFTNIIDTTISLFQDNNFTTNQYKTNSSKNRKKKKCNFFCKNLNHRNK
jgi:hypothetical protein